MAPLILGLNRLLAEVERVARGAEGGLAYDIRHDLAGQEALKAAAEADRRLSKFRTVKLHRRATADNCAIAHSAETDTLED
jgi:hypothetical protein